MRFLGKRLLHLIAVVFAVTALTFLMVNLLPGSVAYEIAGEEATPEDVQAIKEQLGLNENIVVRYLHWIYGVAHGDFGTSLRSHEPVLDAIISRLPVTIELLIIAQIFALLIAIPAGIASAWKAHKTPDKVLGSTAFALVSIPGFVMAIVLIFVFALKLDWLPATGFMPLSEGLWPNLRAFILPSLSIALVEWVPLMRVLRSDMIATLQEDFILVARAKGVPTRSILFKHALRPSSLTLVTLFGIQIGHLVGGAFITETIFALPGIARLFVHAIMARDYVMVQGCVLFITVAYVIVNFVVDMLYSVLDPRIRREKYLA
jgi:peptide/nickel transport system permease protein